MEGSILFHPTFNPWLVDEYKGWILFIGGLPYDCSYQDLYDLLSNYSGVMWMRIEYNCLTLSPKGFAHCMLTTEEGYSKILNDKNLYIRGVKIGCQMWKNPDEYEIERNNKKSRKVFVKRLIPKLTQTVLHQYFTQFGPVESIEIKKNHLDGGIRGIGFVVFKAHQSAAECLKQRFHIIDETKVVCSVCKEKEFKTSFGAIQKVSKKENMNEDMDDLRDIMENQINAGQNLVIRDRLDQIYEEIYFEEERSEMNYFNIDTMRSSFMSDEDPTNSYYDTELSKMSIGLDIKKTIGYSMDYSLH